MNTKKFYQNIDNNWYLKSELVSGFEGTSGSWDKPHSSSDIYGCVENSKQSNRNPVSNVHPAHTSNVHPTPRSWKAIDLRPKLDDHHDYWSDESSNLNPSEPDHVEDSVERDDEPHSAAGFNSTLKQNGNKRSINGSISTSHNSEGRSTKKNADKSAFSLKTCHIPLTCTGTCSRDNNRMVVNAGSRPKQRRINGQFAIVKEEPAEAGSVVESAHPNAASSSFPVVFNRKQKSRQGPRPLPRLNTKIRPNKHVSNNNCGSIVVIYNRPT